MAVLIASAGPFGASAVAAPSGPSAPSIVGGTPAGQDTAPWQVGLVVANVANARNGQFCGGVILSATRIATAAHCAISPPAAGVDVVAGTTTLNPLSAGAQRIRVASIAVHPSYNASTDANDAAYLTLASPLKLSPAAHTAEIQVAPTSPAVGAPVSVSGWGDLQDGANAGTNELRTVELNTVDDGSCSGSYGGNFTADVMLCAAAPRKDSCQGDSGGPLVSGSGASAVLVGLVSTGIGCADSRYPGIYAEVAAPGIRSFLTATVPAPNGAAPALTGGTRVGDVLTCTSGDWTASPSFSYSFVDQQGAQLQSGPAATFTLRSEDVGRTVACDVTASTAAGSAIGPRTAGIGPVTAVPEAPPPAPPTTVTQPPAVVTSTPLISRTAAAADMTAPVARLTTRSCTGRRCVLRLTTRDAGFSTGTTAVTVSVRSRYREACRKGGRRTTCIRSRTRSLKAVRTGAGTFTITATLPYGSHVLTLRARDTSGNRQRVATVVRFTTKAPAIRR